MKCNQNCLKNAGNPRDMRRFQVSSKVSCSLAQQYVQCAYCYVRLTISSIISRVM